MMMTTVKKFYAGIGSRRTPKTVLDLIEYIAYRLGLQGYILRSGGAAGADEAFEAGAFASGAKYKIYLPSAKFNGNKHEPEAGYIDCSSLPTWEKALEMVEKYHPAPGNLNDFTKKLMARSSFQVLSASLDNPVDFVVCWTRDGKDVGGTSQALRIARDFNIPIYNLGLPDTFKKLEKDIF